MAETRPGEIRSLTGLRGVAACFVMLYHFLPDVAGTGMAGTVVKHGYLAVDLFFVLSGFVMAMTYGGEFQSGFKPGTYVRFLLKRLGRVYPLYAVTTLACAALLVADGQAPTWLTLGSNLLLVQGWGLADSLNGPGWSISTELAAYLAFPLLAAAVVFGRWWTVWLAAGLGAAVLAAVAVLPDAAVLADAAGRNGPLDVYMPGTPFPLLRCLAGFVLGLFAWRLAAVPGIRRLAAHGATGTGLAAIVLLALAVRGSDVPLVLLFVPLLVALASGRSLAARLLEVTPIHWLGVVSYSIYLVHRPVIDRLRSPVVQVLDGWQVPHAYSVGSALLVLVTLAVAAASFRLIEKPGREMSRALIGRRPPVLPTGPARRLPR